MSTTDVMKDLAVWAAVHHVPHGLEPAEALANARRRWDAWLAAHDAEVRASVVSEEPDWEYGIVAEAFGGEPDPHPSYEAAAHVRDNTKTLYRKWTHGSEVAIFRRRKAGPWMPVEQEGETDA